MSEDITYCINNKCYKRYRCELYRDAPEIDDERKNFWFVEYKPEICPERDKMNIWEKNYYEQILNLLHKYVLFAKRLGYTEKDILEQYWKKWQHNLKDRIEGDWSHEKN